MRVDLLGEKIEENHVLNFFGDYYSKFYKINKFVNFEEKNHFKIEPEIKVFDIKDNNIGIILGSSGFWNVINSDIIHKLFENKLFVSQDFLISIFNKARKLSIKKNLLDFGNKNKSLFHNDMTMLYVAL